MDINTTDKVQVGDTTGTSTSITASQWQTYNHYKAEQGWECPRCGHINAPWVRQCDCTCDNWTITTSNQTDKLEQWKEIICNSDTFKVHPDSTIYQVGGSDYWNPHTKTYENVPTHVSNKVDPNSVTTAQNTHSTNTIHNRKTNYKE